MADARVTWRAEELGAVRTLDTPAGPVRVHETGSGPPIVFVHGLLVNANLWRRVVERLAPTHRCVTLDLPLGSHPEPRPAAAPVGAGAVVDLIAGAIEALGLEQATLVGNDTGGALCQMVVTRRPERIGRLVLTSCDYRDNYPPRLFSYFVPVARVPGLLAALLAPMRAGLVRRLPIAYGWLTKRPIDARAEDSYVYPAILDSGVRADLRRFVRTLDTADTNAAADALGGFDRPALVAWSADDRVFPRSDGERLARELPQGRFTLVEDSYTFSMEDRPDRLADLVAAFVGEGAPDEGAREPAGTSASA